MFLVDNQVLYTHVFRHVKDCTKCSIPDVLQVYLKRRETTVSSSLVKLAFKYEKLASKRGVDISVLVNEFILRSLSGLQMHSKRLSLEQISNGLILQYQQYSILASSYLRHTEPPEFYKDLLKSKASRELAHRIVDFCLESSPEDIANHSFYADLITWQVMDL